MTGVPVAERAEAPPAGTHHPTWRPFPPHLHVGAVAMVLGGVGVAVAVIAGVPAALLFLGGALGLGLVVLALLVPAVALGLLVVTEFAGVASVAQENELPRLYTPMLALGAVSVVLSLRRAEYRKRLRCPPLAPLALLGVLFVCYVPATLLSVRPYETSVDNEIFFKECAFLLVVLLLAQLVDRPWWLAAMIVLPMAVIGFLAVVNQVFLGSSADFGGFATVTDDSGQLVATERHAGPLPDPNFWGQFLVLGLPFGYALAHRSAKARQWLPTAGYSVVTVLLLAGAYLTGSRGALIAALAATTVWVVASGRGVRRMTLRCLPVAALLLMVPGIGDRLLNLGEAFDDLPSYAIDPSIVERSAAQEIATSMFLERPVFGTGPGTFKYEIYEYASRSPDLLIGVTTAAHNLYLEILAEAGIVGLFGWVAMFAGMLVLAGRAVLLLAGAPEVGRLGGPTRALAAAALASGVGWSVTSVFLHLALVRPVFVLFALIGVVHLRARREAALGGPAARAATVDALRGLRRGAAVGGVAAVGAIATGAVLLVVLARPQYTAESVYTLAPAPGTFESYAIDVRRRTPVLPAYAAMIQSAVPRDGARVDAEPITGMITFRATGDSEQPAADRVAAAIAAAPDRLRRLGADRQYRLVEVIPTVVTAELTHSPTALAVTAAAVLGQTALVLVPVHLRLRGRHLRRQQGSRRT